jgi:hypothetical protein
MCGWGRSRGGRGRDEVSLVGSGWGSGVFDFGGVFFGGWEMGIVVFVCVVATAIRMTYCCSWLHRCGCNIGDALTLHTPRKIMAGTG